MTIARPRSAFAHASEAELARILDFYRVAWEYEPHAYPILYDRDGAVLESFSPDFYLPELDLYIEITTLRQRLVRKKNRKLRRLRDLYPGLRVKLFYARDFRALLLKYGRLSLAGALSGAEGQATPPRRDPLAARSRAVRPATPAAAPPGKVYEDGPPVALASRSRRSRARARARAAARAAVQSLAATKA